MVRVLTLTSNDIEDLREERRRLASVASTPLVLDLLDTLIASGVSASGVRIEVKPIDASDHMLSTGEVAEMFGVSERAVRKWCERSRIIAFQPGGPGADWRIPASQFPATLDEMRNLYAAAKRLSDKYGGPLDDYER